MTSTQSNTDVSGGAATVPARALDGARSRRTFTGPAFQDVSRSGTSHASDGPGAVQRVEGDIRAREHHGRPPGVEIRVHGIGDHATYSALGRPKYKELVDSRVWIGQVPPLPAHPLRLVNWSRANRKITRHLGWYLAFPFTLLNVAGFMEPHDRSRHFMRAGIGVASVCLTLSMAAWLSVILETAWRVLTVGDDRLTAVLLQGAGPGLLILFIGYRMLAGRALVDKAGATISIVTIAALVGMIVFLHSKPASKSGAWIGGTREADPAIDAMSWIVGGTTAIVFLVALCLCVLALWRKRNSAGLAGAAALLVVAVTLLHAAGSVLRRFADSVVTFVPSNHAAPEHVSLGQAMKNVLLPTPDDFGRKVVARVPDALEIDLIPVFFVAMLALFAVVLWAELRGEEKRIDADESRREVGQGFKPASRIHVLVSSLPQRLAVPLTVAILATPVLWALMCAAVVFVDPWFLADVLMVLQVAGAISVVLIVIRRPEELARRLRSVFGSVADIAGFWAPDLHPLAGASYRRALLSGIRQTLNDLVLEYPDSPIALVGHSQGSVACAWFVRGGHWTEQPTEGQTDRHALKARMHQCAGSPRSDRVALFTCGSPLATLYRTFFPRYFDDEFFERVSGMTYRGSWWRNYWRRTDPIGSTVQVKRPTDNVDVTERIDQETLGHGEYWRERRLRAAIDRFFDLAEVSQPKPAKTGEFHS